MIHTPAHIYGKAKLRLVLSIAAACGVTLLVGCGGKSEDTTTPPPPGPSATADTKAPTPPADQKAGTLSADK